MPNSHSYHPNPFGSVMQGRNWTDVNRKYRFTFNGIEKDEDFYNTEFRQYIAELGRWCSQDPIRRSYESAYSSFSNSPIVMIDPDGNSDYYTAGGEYLASDGTDNLDIIIVTDDLVIATIKEKRIANLQDPTYLLYSDKLADGTFFLLPPYEERQQIKKEVNASNNEQEIGGKGWSNMDGSSTYYAPALPGDRVTDKDLMENVKNVHMAQAKGTKEPPSPEEIQTNNPADRDALNAWRATQTGVKASYIWHMHPFRVVYSYEKKDYTVGTEPDEWDEMMTYGGNNGIADSQPSSKDMEKMQGKNYAAYVISKAAGTVTKYNSSGGTTTMSSENFFNLQAKKKPK